MVSVVKITSSEFSSEVENLIVRHSMETMEAIIMVAENKNLELEVVPKLLTSNLKDRLQAECEKMNLISKSGATLPI